VKLCSYNPDSIHQWNYETKHTNYENSTMNYNRDSKTPVILWS